MEKKSHGGLITFIVILVVLVLGLGSYIVYEKFIAPTNDVEVKDGENLDGDKSALSHGDALSVGKELWEYAMSAYWGTTPAWTTSVGEVNEAGGKPINCETTLEEVKKKFSKSFEAESCTSDESVCSTMTIDEFINENSCTGAGRGSLQTYKETNLEVGTVQENEIIFTAISEYCGSSFCQESKETEKTVAKDFIISKENGEWVIKKFYLPN